MLCSKYCFERPFRRSDATIKREILLILNRHGVETNSKVASVAPGWANEVLKVSIGFGYQRYRNISFYLAGLCEKLSKLTDDQKKAVEKDPMLLAMDPITTLMLRGQSFCKEASGDGQLDLIAA